MAPARPPILPPHQSYLSPAGLDLAVLPQYVDW